MERYLLIIWLQKASSSGVCEFWTYKNQNNPPPGTHRRARPAIRRPKGLTRVVFPGSSRSQSKRSFPPRVFTTENDRGHRADKRSAARGRATPRTGNGEKTWRRWRRCRAEKPKTSTRRCTHPVGAAVAEKRFSGQHAFVVLRRFAHFWKFQPSGGNRAIEQQVATTAASFSEDGLAGSGHETGMSRGANGRKSHSERRGRRVGGGGVGRTSRCSSAGTSRSLTAVGMLVRCVSRDRRSPQT